MKKATLLLSILLSGMLTLSCSMPSYEDLFPGKAEAFNVEKSKSATATYKINEDGIKYFRIDASTNAEIVNPDAVADLTVGKRVIAWYNELSDHVSSDFFKVKILVGAALQIEEGEVAAAQSAPEDYGSPVDIIQDPVSSIEDGFLTLRYRIIHSGNIKHGFRLTYNPESPTLVHFIHQSNGDIEGEVTDGIICFPLDFLPEGCESVEVEYKALSGAITSIVYRTDV